MAATWQPQEAGVTELVQLFKDSQTPGKETQMRIAEVSPDIGPLLEVSYFPFPS